MITMIMGLFSWDNRYFGRLVPTFYRSTLSPVYDLKM